MKNILTLSLVIVFSMIIFSSCKKRYKCECINTDDNGQEYTIENPYLHKLSKSQAEDEKAKCEATTGCSFKRDK